MSKVVDMKGKRYEKLLVVKRDKNDKRGQACWLCVCDCGKEIVCNGNDLRSNRYKSCGCAKAERAAILGYGNAKHHDSFTRLYRVWNGMKQRVLNENRPKYKYYGGRGISICEEWISDFPAFKKWALEAGYDKDAEFGECTLDRIDPYGDYEPSNCRWVPIKIQNRNKRKKVRR